MHFLLDNGSRRDMTAGCILIITYCCFCGQKQPAQHWWHPTFRSTTLISFLSGLVSNKGSDNVWPLRGSISYPTRIWNPAALGYVYIQLQLLGLLLIFHWLLLLLWKIIRRPNESWKEVLTPLKETTKVLLVDDNNWRINTLLAAVLLLASQLNAVTGSITLGTHNRMIQIPAQ